MRIPRSRPYVEMHSESVPSLSLLFQRHSRPFLPFFVCLGLFFLFSDLWGQQAVSKDTSPPLMNAYPLSSPPRVDGVVDEDWMGMEPARRFVQQLPDEGKPASEETEVRIGFTQDTLYIGLICYDSQPQGIVSTQARRDGVLGETDSFEVLFDTYDDDQNGYIFATTPAGIEYDAQIVHGGQSRVTGGPTRAGSAGRTGFGGAQSGAASSFNLNWDGVWTVQTQITSRGWEAEFAIPFRTLRYAPGEKVLWGINFKRNIRRRNEQVFWAPVSRAFRLHRVSLAGELHGLDLPFLPNFQVVPFITGGFSQDLRQEISINDEIYGAGLDVKYTLTSSLILDLTVNTDFSQVEVDEEQVNLTRFDLFFPEKRPFFLENAGLFQVGTPRQVELFFSRRIGIDPSGVQVPVLGGARVSGKQGAFNIGFLNMQTESIPEVTPAHNFTVARLVREVGRRSSFGAMFINKSATSDQLGSDSFNRTFGLDANLGFGDHLTIFNYLAKTQTPGLSGRDHAAGTDLRYDADLYSFRTAYTEVGEDFNPEVGFLERVGYRKPSYGVYYNPHPKDHPFIRRLWPHHTWQGHYRFDGEPESGFRHNHFNVFFNNGGSAGIAYNQNFEQLFDPFEIAPGLFLPVGLYNFDNWSFSLDSDSSANLFSRVSYSWGEFYTGNIQTLNVSSGIRSGSNFLISSRYVLNNVSLPQGDFATHLGAIQFNYSFTPKSYLQALVQYNNSVDEIGANIRLAVLRTGNTGFFIVYNSRFDTTGLDPHEADALLRMRAPRRTLDRALIAKFTYLFDF